MNAKKAKQLRRELKAFNERRKLEPESVTVEQALTIRGQLSDRQIRRAHKFMAKRLLAGGKSELVQKT